MRIPSRPAGVALAGAAVLGMWWVLPAGPGKGKTAGPYSRGLGGEKAAAAVPREFRTPDFPEAPEMKARQLNGLLNGTKQDPRGQLDRVREVMKGWAEGNPRAAMEYALAPLGDDQVNAVFLEVVSDLMTLWAGRDPEAARAFVVEWSSDPARVHALAPALMRVYSHLKPGEAFAWVAVGIDSDSGELRPLLAAELVKAYCEDGRKPQIRAWLAVPEVARSAYAQSATMEFARRLARENPQEALDFAASLPSGSMSRGLALQESVRQWTSDRPQLSHDWLAGVVRDLEARPPSAPGRFAEAVREQVAAGVYSEAELDHAIAGYVLGMAAGDPENARMNAASIQDPSLRKRVLQSLQM